VALRRYSLPNWAVLRSGVWAPYLHSHIATEKYGRRSRRQDGTCGVCLIAIPSPLKKRTLPASIPVQMACSWSCPGRQSEATCWNCDGAPHCPQASRSLRCVGPNRLGDPAVFHIASVAAASSQLRQQIRCSGHPIANHHLESGEARGVGPHRFSLKLHTNTGVRVFSKADR